MTQQTANVVDFSAYRERRQARSLAEASHGFLQGGWIFAVPVAMPVMVAWLPVWTTAGADCSHGTEDE